MDVVKRHIDSLRGSLSVTSEQGKGACVALGERECSMQRRHQKVIEESPSAAPFFAGDEGEARRQKLYQDALAIVNAVGYVGAGTVEFVASPEGELFFLEVNARLQVEHCVTEMVTRLDLVEQQLRVASGEALAPEVVGATRSGHSIEARIYAEDPAKKFAPQPGHLKTLVWPTIEGDLRVETGFVEGQDVTPFYDPMLAKLVAFGATRDAAIARLDRALAETRIELVGPVGPSQTNVGFLRKLIAAEGFRTAHYDTTFAEALAKSP